jgi:hypothetical protein
MRTLFLATTTLLFAFSGALHTTALRSEPTPSNATPSSSAPKTPRDWRQFDISGDWVSVVDEDWAYRMGEPALGDIGSIPSNRVGRDTAAKWRSGGTLSCKTFGAAGIMRQPGRIHITWSDDHTLQFEFDAGMQRRVLHFPRNVYPFGYPTSRVPAAFIRRELDDKTASRQGYSVAVWRKQGNGRGFLEDAAEWTMPQPNSGGSLMVITRNMLPGYLQKNGVPYGANAVLTEFYDLLSAPDGTDWLVVTSTVDDPENLYEPYITSTQFKREGDRGGWQPKQCQEE